MGGFHGYSLICELGARREMLATVRVKPMRSERPIFLCRRCHPWITLMRTTVATQSAMKFKIWPAALLLVYWSFFSSHPCTIGHGIWLGSLWRGCRGAGVCCCGGVHSGD